MSIAAFPFNAGPNTSPALARQLANFAVDTVRSLSGKEIHQVNLLSQVEADTEQFVLVNPSEGINEYDILMQLMANSDGIDEVMDGLLLDKGAGKYELTFRIHNKAQNTPLVEEKIEFDDSGLFDALGKVIVALAQRVEHKVDPATLAGDELFGTGDVAAFKKFLEGYDALQYIDRAQGRVIAAFDPGPSLDLLLEALATDPEWEGPYMTAVQLCRASTQLRLGTPDKVVQTLTKLVDIAKDDSRALFALAEFYEAANDLQKATEALEEAHRREPNEPAILSRLGLLQIRLNMPVNAERNFRKAVEMEGDDKPSMDLLAQVLEQTGRAHEVPPLWKAIIDANPKNASALAKHAAWLIKAGKEDEGARAFDLALETLEDNTLIKRYYAPYLSQKGDLDRAMDYYEDCLDAAPADVPLLLEYAQTLQKAERAFEVPKILRDVLNLPVDQNTRANVGAWLIELDQPKRVEAVGSAQQRLEAGDADGAIRELKPLVNWLGDYWKMWLVLAQAYNRAGQFDEAEKASVNLLNLYPGFEPGYAELVSALGGQGRNEEAYNVLRNAIVQFPSSVPIAINLALAAKRTGRSDEARGLAKQLREAIGNDQNLEPVFAELER